MKHILPGLVLLGLLSGCLPTRRDVDGGAVGDDVAVDDTVEDAADVTATAGDAKSDTKDVTQPDVPQLGCKTDGDCAAFNDTCHTAACDIASGICQATALPDDTTCVGADDKCAQSQTCKAGACIKVPLVCDDSNACTVEICDPASGCPAVGTAIPATCGLQKKQPCPCDDGNSCTIGDVCKGAVCKGETLKCDDKNPCTTDACDGTAGCVSTPVPDGQPCDDGQKYCTTGDQCTSGTCKGTPTACDTPPNTCTLVMCTEQNKGCAPNPGSGPCDDGDPCTTADTCIPDPNTTGNGLCQGTPNTCDDKNECTDDACVPGTGCVNTPNAATTCKVSGAGTCASSGTCAAGVCQAPANACDDANVCTDDACDAKKGCVHTNNAAACNDGNACTYSEACSGGTCGGSLDVSTDDGTPCTLDACDPVAGPHWTVQGNGTGCGTGKACTGGVCLASKPCGDGICAATETYSTCPADCPLAGGQCASSDTACIGTCRAKICADEVAVCNPGDDGCTAMLTCTDACTTPACILACLLPTGTSGFATSLQMWINIQRCSGAQCVANDWMGKPCVPGTPDYTNCAPGCESSACAVAAFTCQTTNGCTAQRTCLQACASDSTCEANCPTNAAATVAAKALLQCSMTNCQ